MQFEDLYSLFKQYEHNATELNTSDTLKHKVKSDKTKIAKLELEQENIEFNLLLPYKLLELLQQASNEKLKLVFGREDEDFSVTLYDPVDRYNNAYLSLITTVYEVGLAESLINSIKNRKLEEERLVRVKQQALDKLTKEEKEVLGL